MTLHGLFAASPVAPLAPGGSGELLASIAAIRARFAEEHRRCMERSRRAIEASGRIL